VTKVVESLFSSVHALIFASPAWDANGASTTAAQGCPVAATWRIPTAILGFSLLPPDQSSVTVRRCLCAF
jgi:hypothetical protein